MEPKSTWVGTVLGWSPIMALLVGEPLALLGKYMDRVEASTREERRF